MEKLIRRSLLFDIYGALLTQTQYDVFRAYVLEDLSLQEIAEISGISKQAVSENLKRAEQRLERYEDQLGLLARAQKREQALKQMAREIERISVLNQDQALCAPIDRLRGRLEELMKGL